MAASSISVMLNNSENRLVEQRVQTTGVGTATSNSEALTEGLRPDRLGRIYENIGAVTGTTIQSRNQVAI